MDYSKYFEHNEKEQCYRFIGNKLVVYLPSRYQALGHTNIDETVSTIGVFTMEIDGNLCGLQIPAILSMDPSTIEEKTINDTKYTLLTFNKGDRFLVNDCVIQRGDMGYVLWKEFMGLGNLPSYITYENIFTLYDDLGEIAGRGIAVNHAVLELVFAHIFRDKKDLSIEYRHTPMNGNFEIIGVHNVAYGVTSTHGRLMRSYTTQGINAALLHPNDKNYDYGDVYRQ